MVPDNGGCAPNVDVDVVFFTLITDLPVGTASNQLMNVSMVRELTIYRERYVSCAPTCWEYKTLLMMFYL